MYVEFSQSRCILIWTLKALVFVENVFQFMVSKVLTVNMKVN
jgi:hypothetical protein